MSINKVVTNIVLTLGIMAAFFFLGRQSVKPVIIEQIDTVITYLPVDSSEIISKARTGFVRYDKEKFLEEFGSIFKDTSTIFNIIDSVNIIDSINYINVKTLSADTVYHVFLEDALKSSKFKCDVFIGATAYLSPFNLIKFNLSTRNADIVSNQTSYIKVEDWRWYYNFNMSIGAILPTFEPAVTLGYGFSIGDFNRLIKR